MKFGFTTGLLGVLVASMAVLSQTAYGQSTIGVLTSVVVDPKNCKAPARNVSAFLSDKEYAGLSEDCQNLLKVRKSRGQCNSLVSITAAPVYSRSDPKVPIYAEFRGDTCIAYYACLFNCVDGYIEEF
jgi:hypothetical protein